MPIVGSAQPHAHRPQWKKVASAHPMPGPDPEGSAQALAELK
jgi:hypothetical protein